MGTVNTVNSTDPLIRVQSILKMRSFKFLAFLLLIATVSSASLNSLLDEEGGEVVANDDTDDGYEYEYDYYEDGDYDYEEEDDEEENLEEDQEEDLEEEDLEEEQEEDLEEVEDLEEE